jgi:hypothetical protein
MRPPEAAGDPHEHATHTSLWDLLVTGTHLVRREGDGDG